MARNRLNNLLETSRNILLPSPPVAAQQSFLFKREHVPAYLPTSFASFARPASAEPSMTLAEVQEGAESIMDHSPAKVEKMGRQI
jgi:hypothetical protein